MIEVTQDENQSVHKKYGLNVDETMNAFQNWYSYFQIVVCKYYSGEKQLIEDS